MPCLCQLGHQSGQNLHAMQAALEQTMCCAFTLFSRQSYAVNNVTCQKNKGIGYLDLPQQELRSAVPLPVTGQARKTGSIKH
jgi:hypothetical protein